MNKPEITRSSIFDMQVCVPSDWTDEQVKTFVDYENPCGTTMGWYIRKDGDERLAGAFCRIQCEKRTGFVHIMLDA